MFGRPPGRPEDAQQRRGGRGLTVSSAGEGVFRAPDEPRKPAAQSRGGVLWPARPGAPRFDARLPAHARMPF